MPVHEDRLLVVLDEIREFSQLSGNWNGDDEVAPTTSAIVAAFTLILASVKLDVSNDFYIPAGSTPIADGGIETLWKGPRSKIFVQAEPGGSYGYIAKWGDEVRPRFESASDVALGAILPLIKRVVGVAQFGQHV